MIIGELINTSRTKVNEAVKGRDAAAIQLLAKKQVKAGADYLDVNCGTLGSQELEMMQWMVNTIQQVTDIPLCIDSPSPQVLEAGLKLVKTGKPMINSITAEKNRFSSVLSLVKTYDTKVIALCHDDTGIPQNIEERLKVASTLIDGLVNAGMKIEDIYIDLLVPAISTGYKSAFCFLESIRKVKKLYPGVNTVCGLSNVSYGLPLRSLLNKVFLTQSMAMGMDSYILDPTNKEITSALLASKALLGQDDYCNKYLSAYRGGTLS